MQQMNNDNNTHNNNEDINNVKSSICYSVFFVKQHSRCHQLSLQQSCVWRRSEA